LTGVVKEGEYPLDHHVWADTSIHLPKSAPSLWKDAITQQGVKGQGALLAGDIMRHFPVTMLVGKEDI
jgi:(1->4)-alpha-D-glucan 1-alpha-D-glucosylmutase